MSGPRITRKVTVEVSKKVTESGSVPSSIVQQSSSSSSSSARRSVFERLGPGADRPKQRDTYTPDKCRNWLRDGRCPYGNSCKFLHGPFTDPKPRTKSVRSIVQSGSKDRYEDSDDKQLYHSRSFDSADYDDEDVREPPKMKKRHKSEEEVSDSSVKKSSKSKKKHKDEPENDDEEVKTKRKRKAHKKRDASPKAKPRSHDDDDEWDTKEGLMKDYEVKGTENWEEHGDLDFERQLELERRRQDLQRQLALMDEEDAAASAEEASGWKGKEKDDDQRKVPIVHSKLHPNPSPSTTDGDTPTQGVKKKKKKKTDPESKKKIKKEASPRKKDETKRKVSLSADEEVVLRKEENMPKSKAKKPVGGFVVSSDEADRLEHRQPERESRKASRHVAEAIEKESIEPSESPPRSRAPPEESIRKRPEDDQIRRKPEAKPIKEKRKPESSIDDQTSGHADDGRSFRSRDDSEDYYPSPDEQEDANRRARPRASTSRKPLSNEPRIDEGRSDDRGRRRETEERVSSRGPRTPSPPHHTKRDDEHYYYDERQEETKKKRAGRAPASSLMEGNEVTYRKETRSRPEDTHMRGPRTPSDDEGRFSPPPNQGEAGRSNRFSERDRPPPPRRERDVSRDRVPEQGDQRYPDRAGRGNIEGDYDKRKPQEEEIRGRRPPPRTTEDYPRSREDDYLKHRGRDDDYPRDTREEVIPRNLKRELREEEYPKGKYRDERTEEFSQRSRGVPRERDDVEFAPRGRGRGERDNEGRGRPPQRDIPQRDVPYRRGHDYPEAHDRDPRDEKERPRSDYVDSRNRERPDERGKDPRYGGAQAPDHFRRPSPSQGPPRGRSPTHRYDDRRRPDDSFRLGPGGREGPGRGRAVGRGRGSYGYDSRGKPIDTRRRSPLPPGPRPPYQERDRGPPRGGRDGPMGRGRGYADKNRPPNDRYRDQDAPWERPRERDFSRDHRKLFEEPRDRRVRDTSPPSHPPPPVYREERPWEERDRREGPPPRSSSIPVQDRRTPYEADHDGKGRTEHRERNSLERGGQEWEYEEGVAQDKPLRKRTRPTAVRPESPFESKKPRAQSPISPDEGPGVSDVPIEPEEPVKVKKSTVVTKDGKKIKKKKKEGKIAKASVEGGTELPIAVPAGVEEGKVVKAEKKVKKEKKLKEKGAKKKKKIPPAAPLDDRVLVEDIIDEPTLATKQETPLIIEKAVSPKLGKKRKQFVSTEDTLKDSEKPIKKKKKKKHQPEVLVQPWNDLEGDDNQDELKADEKVKTKQSTEEKSSEVVPVEAKQDEMFSDWSDDDSPVGEDSWPDEDSQKSVNEKPPIKVDHTLKDSPISDVEKGPSFDDVYDPISDDEFEAMYTQSDEEEAKKDEKESASKALGVEDVDWSSLGLSGDINKEKDPVSHLEKFKPPYVFSRIGISPTLAGQRLTQLVQEACVKPQTNETKEEPGKELFIPEEGPKCIGSFVAATAAKKRAREGLLSNLGPCRRALCARRDLAIRKQLGRSSKFCKMALFAAAPATPVDNELFQMSVALYKKESNENGVRVIPSKVGSILLTQA